LKKENHFFCFKLGWVAVIFFVINVIFFYHHTLKNTAFGKCDIIVFFFGQNIRNSMFRCVWSFYIQNQFWFKPSKQHQLITITFKQLYPNINQFISNSLLIKINSLKLNSIKINYRHRQTKHTLCKPKAEIGVNGATNKSSVAKYIAGPHNHHQE
jgi:hypothetical protein